MVEAALAAVRPPFVFRATEPTARDVAGVVAALRGSPVTYPDVGATRGALPAGWHHDALEQVIGVGDAVAQAAERALRAWTMFDLGWVRWHGGQAPQEEGQMVAFTAHTLGVWSINVCRVVYRIEEDDGVVRRVGFAYGTLPGHVLRGEERFLLTHDRRSGEVRFGVRKFSRPTHPLLRLTLPWMTRVQRRFSEDAIARLARAAGGGA